MTSQEVKVTPIGEMIDYIHCYQIINQMAKQKTRMNLDEELFPNID